MQKIFIKIMMLKILFFGLVMHTVSFAISNHIDAHVHGVSEMTIVMEREILEIEMKSPAMNLVGFEYAAKTPKDIAIVEKAKQLLQKHNELFTFSGGNCAFVKRVIDSSALIENDNHKHNHEESEHNEVIASYRYRCEKISSLSSITVNLFDFFHELQEINVMWVTEAQQGAITLNTKQKKVHFR